MDLTTGPLRGRGLAAGFLNELIPKVASLPGVTSVAAATGVPLESPAASQPITREGIAAVPSAQSPQVVPNAVTPGYFNVMGMGVRAGRACKDSDTADSTLVAIINETAAAAILAERGSHRKTVRAWQPRALRQFSRTRSRRN